MICSIVGAGAMCVADIYQKIINDQSCLYSRYLRIIQSRGGLVENVLVSGLHWHTLMTHESLHRGDKYWELNCARRKYPHSPHFLFQQFCKFKKNTLFVSDEKKCQCNENLHSRSRSFHLLLHFIKIRFSKNISNKITSNKVRYRDIKDILNDVNLFIFWNVLSLAKLQRF